MLTIFLKLAVPAVLTNLASYACGVTNQVFAGRMGDPEKLAGVGLATATCSMMMLTLMIGLNAAQETLTSQAFGASNLRLCGVYLNRGWFILAAFFIPLAVIPACFAEKIFEAIG